MNNDKYNKPKPVAPQLKDPLKVAYDCRFGMKELERGYRKELHQLLAKAAHVAIQFDRDHKAWVAFVKDPFWEKEKKKPKPNKVTRRQPLSFVMQFILEAREKRDKKRAWKYQRCVRFVQQRGASIETIPTMIEELGGIEEVCRLSAKDARERK